MNVKFVCGAFRRLDGLFGQLQKQEFGECEAASDLPAPYTALCCGTWMSTAKAAIDLWSQAGNIPDKADDQRILNKLFEDGLGGLTVPVTPDTRFKLFATLFPHNLTRKMRNVDLISITEKNILHCGVTDSEPILVHGLANMNLEGILKQMKFKNWK